MLKNLLLKIIVDYLLIEFVSFLVRSLVSLNLNWVLGLVCLSEKQFKCRVLIELQIGYQSFLGMLENLLLKIIVDYLLIEFVSFLVCSLVSLNLNWVLGLVCLSEKQFKCRVLIELQSGYQNFLGMLSNLLLKIIVDYLLIVFRSFIVCSLVSPKQM